MDSVPPKSHLKKSVRKETADAPEEPVLEPRDVEHLSALQLCDLLSATLRLRGANPWEIRLLRDRIEEMEVLQDQARQAVEQLTEAVEKLRAPALRLATVLPIQ